MNGGNITESDRREGHNAEIRNDAESGLYSLGSPRGSVKEPGCTYSVRS